MPQNPQQLILRPEWIQTKEAREKALSKKHIVATELWSRGTRGKNDLLVGETVAIQNMIGRNKNMWTLSGVVVDKDGPESYWVKVDGSGRLTKRKRHHLKPIKPFIDTRSEHVSRNVDNVLSKSSTLEENVEADSNQIPRRSRRLQQSSGGGREIVGN